MSGAGIASAGSMLQQAWDFIASLPDVLVYGMAVVLGLVVLKRLRPSATSALIDRPVTAMSPATSSPPMDQDSLGPGTSSAADDASRQADTEEGPAAAASSTVDEAQSINPSQSEPKDEPIQPSTGLTDTPSENPKWTVIDETRDDSTNYMRDQVYPPRFGTPHHHRTGRVPRKKPVTRSVRDEIPTETHVRRHLVEGIEVNTGVEPISTDYTWSAAELDLGVSGASVDAGGELISVDALPSAASYEFVDSLVDVSPPSILRLLLRTSAPSTPSEKQADIPQTQSRESRKLRRDGSNEHHRQRTRAAPQKEIHGLDGGYGNGTPERELYRQDQATVTDAPPQPSTSRILDASQQRHPVNQTHDSCRSSAARTARSTFNEPGPADDQYEPALDTSTVDDVFSGPYLQPWEQEDTTAGMKPDSYQQNRRDGRPVSAIYEYSPLSWTPLHVDPLTVDIHHDRMQGTPGTDAAEPFREVGNPLTEMEHGLEAIGIDSTLVDPDSADVGPMLDVDLPDNVGDVFGFGEVTDRFEDEPLVPGLPTGAEPLLPSVDEMGEAWPDESIRF